MSDSMFSAAFDVLIKILEIYRPQILSHVDDILVTRSDDASIQAAKDYQQYNLNIHDLGTPHYFLRLEFTY